MPKPLLSLAAITLLLAGGSVWPVYAQAPTAPPRDARPEPARGTASISGRVTAADSRRPLRRVRISIAGPALNGPARTATTDGDGRNDAELLASLRTGAQKVDVPAEGTVDVRLRLRPL